MRIPRFPILIFLFRSITGRKVWNFKTRRLKILATLFTFYNFSQLQILRRFYSRSFFLIDSKDLSSYVFFLLKLHHNFFPDTLSRVNIIHIGRRKIHIQNASFHKNMSAFCFFFFKFSNKNEVRWRKLSPPDVNVFLLMTTLLWNHSKAGGRTEPERRIKHG